MKPIMRKCRVCGHYTLEMKCPKCGGETITVHPPKFSPDDKYARYRIQERYQQTPQESKEE
ncbi:MAG: RNA-protein complex protein Nop10 [Thaumarchaeota archaeon]|nr:RNA-protein complex protein Nop10 [Nitrososphaerota archaeon]MCL5317581.1 RNA-protein complex protein Nop10 [Nitrososphaerota archaeon]